MFGKMGAQGISGRRTRLYRCVWVDVWPGAVGGDGGDEQYWRERREARCAVFDRMVDFLPWIVFVRGGVGTNFRLCDEDLSAGSHFPDRGALERSSAVAISVEARCGLVFVDSGARFRSRSCRMRAR